MSPGEIAAALRLDALRHHPVHLQPCCAPTGTCNPTAYPCQEERTTLMHSVWGMSAGEGLYEGLEWLLATLDRRRGFASARTGE